MQCNVVYATVCVCTALPRVCIWICLYVICGCKCVCRCVFTVIVCICACACFFFCMHAFMYMFVLIRLYLCCRTSMVTVTGPKSGARRQKYTERQLTSPGDPIRRVQGTQMASDKWPQSRVCKQFLFPSSAHLVFLWWFFCINHASWPWPQNSQ